MLQTSCTNAMQRERKGMLAQPAREAATTVRGARGPVKPCSRGRESTSQDDTPRSAHRFRTGCGEPLEAASARLLASSPTGPSLVSSPFGHARGPQSVDSIVDDN